MWPFFFLAFVSAGFLFWRKAREEHYEEAEVFDGFLRSTLVGLIGSRIGYLIFQFPLFEWEIGKWFNMYSYPGFNLLFGGLLAALYIYRYAQKKKWDVFEVVDFWSLSFSFGLGVVWVGMFIEGTGFGNATALPWGVLFPGVIERHHPIQLYFAAMYFLLFWYLSWADFNYRTFSWYRAGKNTAQTGFMTSIFLIVTSGFSLMMSFIRPPQLVLFGWQLDALIYTILTLLGGYLLFTRSGRTLKFSRRPRSTYQSPTPPTV